MIRYAVIEAFDRFRRAPGLALLSLLVTGVLIYLFGIFLLLTANLNQIIADVRTRIEMTAYFKTDAEQKQMDAAVAAIGKMTGVKACVFYSKNENLKQFKKEFADQRPFLDAIEVNPLPASARIQIKPAYKTAENVTELAAAVRRLKGIEKVQFGGDWIARLDRIVSNFQLVDITLGIVIALGGIFIISNTIKLSVFARRDAIEIMKLVGATNMFIRMPIIIEGLLNGLLGGLTGIGLLAGTYHLARQQVTVLAALDVRLLLILTFLAAILGATGSYVSMRKFLDI